MRYIITFLLLSLGLVVKSQPYPSSNWPNPLPTTNLNMVQVMDWMMKNGEIDRLDLFVSNSGIGQYVRKDVSIIWLYGKSRLTATPIKLTNWNGYAVVPKRVPVAISNAYNNLSTNVCGDTNRGLWYVNQTDYPIRIGSTFYATEDGPNEFTVAIKTKLLDTNQWMIITNGIVTSMGGC